VVYGELLAKISSFNRLENKMGIILTTWQTISELKDLRASIYIIYESDSLDQLNDIQRILESIAKANLKDLKIVRIVCEGVEQVLQSHCRKNDFSKILDTQNFKGAQSDQISSCNNALAGIADTVLLKNLTLTALNWISKYQSLTPIPPPQNKTTDAYKKLIDSNFGISEVSPQHYSPGQINTMIGSISIADHWIFFDGKPSSLPPKKWQDIAKELLVEIYTESAGVGRPKSGLRVDPLIDIRSEIEKTRQVGLPRIACKIEDDSEHFFDECCETDEGFTGEGRGMAIEDLDTGTSGGEVENDRFTVLKEKVHAVREGGKGVEKGGGSGLPSAGVIYGFDFVKRFDFLDFTMKYGISFDNLDFFYKK
jgi:hypothetical protein